MKRPATVPPRAVAKVQVDSTRAGRRRRRPDEVAVEEPLEIRLEDRGTVPSLGITMRTPGHDFELVTGLLVAEGILRRRSDLAGIAHGSDRDGAPDPNVVVARLARGATFDPEVHRRAALTTSACGVCGRGTIETLLSRGVPRLEARQPRVGDAVLRSLPEKLRRGQTVFRSTGGLHAAGLFDAQGRVGTLREDVGRHNAVDKVVGAEFLEGRLPLRDQVLVVSGRASFEILQKAVVGGVAFMGSVGAPSSLAVDVAHAFGVTLVGFLSRDGYNVYTGAERLVAARAPRAAGPRTPT